MQLSDKNLWQLQMSWASYVSQGHLFSDVSIRHSAEDFIYSYMERANRNVSIIVEKLDATGYQFLYPEAAHVKPDKNAKEWMESLRSKQIYVPLSLQAWLEVVGNVNLMGTHPLWDYSGYSGMGPEVVFHTDPLVVDVDESYIRSEYEAWECRVAEDGLDEAGPFRVSFAPDDIHKANVSGGAPYELDVDKPDFDSIVYNERHGHTFVAHIRNAFRWGGFPGFELEASRPNEFLDSIAGSLVEF